LQRNCAVSLHCSDVCWYDFYKLICFVFFWELSPQAPTQPQAQVLQVQLPPQGKGQTQVQGQVKGQAHKHISTPGRQPQGSSISPDSEKIVKIVSAVMSSVHQTAPMSEPRIQHQDSRFSQQISLGADGGLDWLADESTTSNRPINVNVFMQPPSQEVGQMPRPRRPRGAPLPVCDVIPSPPPHYEPAHYFSPHTYYERHPPHYEQPPPPPPPSHPYNPHHHYGYYGHYTRY